MSLRKSEIDSLLSSLDDPYMLFSNEELLSVIYNTIDELELTIDDILKDLPEEISDTGRWRLLNKKVSKKSDEELLDVVRNYHRMTGRIPTKSLLYRESPELIKRFKTWKNVLKEAGLKK